MKPLDSDSLALVGSGADALLLRVQQLMAQREEICIAVREAWARDAKLAAECEQLLRAARAIQATIDQQHASPGREDAAWTFPSTA